MATVPRRVEYPTGDGKPMAETTVHRDAMIDLIRMLERHYADDPMAYVSGNMLMYYEEGNRRKRLAPDVFVTRGIPKRLRHNYLTWEEGKGPDFVIEVTSKSTRREDQGKKRDLCRDILRVREYFLFDPLAEYLRPPLQGYRLVGGDYLSIKSYGGRLASLTTGLILEAVGPSLRLFSPELDRWLHTEAERAAMEARRADVKALARRVAEAEVERLRRELEIARPQGAGG